MRKNDITLIVDVVLPLCYICMIDLQVKEKAIVNQTDFWLLMQFFRFFNLRDYKWSIEAIVEI